MNPTRTRTALPALLWGLWLPVLLLVLWWFGSATANNPFFPPLQDILTSFVTTWFGPGFTQAIVPSMTNWAAGVAIAIVVGIGAGTILARLPRVELVLDPYLQFLRALPVVALIPVSLVALGTANSQKIALIAFAGTWPILLNTVDGIKSLHPELLQTARTFRLNRRDVFLRVLFPGAFPQISIGIRLTLSISLVVMIASEIYASTQGIGYYVISAQQQFDTVALWSGVILLGLIGYIVTVLYGLLEAYLLRWRVTPRP